MNRLQFAALIALCPLVALGQTADVVPPPADPLLAGLGELVQHAKLGRTVLAILAGVVLVVRLVLRYGPSIPGAVGAWLGGPTAAWALPAVIGVVGGISTSVANGGTWYDGLIGGIVVGLGAWLPVGKPAALTPPAPGVNTTADAAAVFQGKGPQP